jgi:hypothetical protein
MFGLSEHTEGWINFGIGFGLALIVVAVVLLYRHWRSGSRW